MAVRWVEAEGARVCVAARRGVAEPHEAVVFHCWTKVPSIDAVGLLRAVIVGILEGETFCAHWGDRCFVPVELLVVKIVIS